MKTTSFAQQPLAEAMPIDNEGKCHQYIMGEKTLVIKLHAGGDFYPEIEEKNFVS